jgi:hypothetical protein
VSGVLVNVQEAGQRVHQVVEGRREVGGGVLLPPALDALAVALVLLQRRGVEHAEDIALHPHCFHVLAALARGTPVKMVHVLQQSEHAGIGKRDTQYFGDVVGREMRFPE